MKYGWIPFACNLAIWFFAVDVRFFMLNTKENPAASRYSHGLYLHIGVTAGSVASCIYYFRQSKLYKRNIAAMQYDEI
jgi:hypothetical protein